MIDKSQRFLDAYGICLGTHRQTDKDVGTKVEGSKAQNGALKEKVREKKISVIARKRRLSPAKAIAGPKLGYHSCILYFSHIRAKNEE